MKTRLSHIIYTTTVLILFTYPNVRLWAQEDVTDQAFESHQMNCTQEQMKYADPLNALKRPVEMKAYDCGLLGREIRLTAHNPTRNTKRFTLDSNFRAQCWGFLPKNPGNNLGILLSTARKQGDGILDPVLICSRCRVAGFERICTEPSKVEKEALLERLLNKRVQERYSKTIRSFKHSIESNLLENPFPAGMNGFC